MWRNVITFRHMGMTLVSTNTNESSRRMCISVKKFQRTKFDVSQKPLIQKMHTEPEILNWMLGGVICHSDLFLCDSPARPRG